MIENDTRLYLLFNSMFDQIPPKKALCGESCRQPSSARRYPYVTIDESSHDDSTILE